MARTLVVLLVVVAVGALLFYGFNWVTQNQSLTGQPQIQTPQLPQPQDINTPGGATPTQEEIDRLRTQLFEEGITVRATVDEVYPGVGFIIRDDSGERMFVRWTGDEPEIDQPVSLLGTVSRISGQEEFRQDDEFTQKLEDFLQDQRIFIEAREVNPA